MSEDADRPLTVLQSMAAPTPGVTRFADHMDGGLRAAGVTPLFFTPRTALFGRYDVVHVHWPESLVRGRGRVDTVARYGLAATLLARWRLTRTPLVRTEHNSTPHDGVGRAERVVLRWVDRMTTHTIVLHTDPSRTARGPVTHVPHGDYVARFAGLAVDVPRRPGRVLFSGLVKPYKRVGDLVRVFRRLDDPALTLRIVGRPERPALRQEIEAAAAGDARISTRWEFVPDADLVAEMRAASLVVLPYHELENSGVALVALSVDRPVLVPDTPSTRELREEAGDDWVHLFTPPLGAEALATAVAAADDLGGRPALRGRDWPTVGRAVAAVYRRAVAAGRAQ